MPATPKKTRIKREVGYGKPPTGKRFKPGCPPGPGRPPGESLTAKINRLLDEPDPKHGTKGDALVVMAVKMARKGDFRFWKEIIDRRDGKVPDRIADANGKAFAVKILRGVSMDEL